MAKSVEYHVEAEAKPSWKPKYDLRKHAHTITDIVFALAIDLTSSYSLWNLLLVPSGNSLNIARTIIYGSLAGSAIYFYKGVGQFASRIERDEIFDRMKIENIEEV